MVAASVLIGVAVIVLSILWIYKKEKARKEVDKIPGPPILPILGNAHQLSTDGKEFTDDMYELSQNYRRDGCFRLWLGYKPITAVFEPEFLERAQLEIVNFLTSLQKAELLDTEFYRQIVAYSHQYAKNGMFRLWLGISPLIAIFTADKIEPLLNSSKHMDKSDEYRFLHPWLGTGLLTSTGDKWRVRRKLLTPTFHFKILNDFTSVFNDQAKIMVKKLSEVADGGTFDIFPFITLCALDIICETAMGQSVDAQSNKDSEYVEAVYKITDLILLRMRHPWLWPDFLYYTIGQGRLHDKYLHILHSFTEKVIRERKTQLSNSGEENMSMEDIIDRHTEDEDYVSKSKRLAFLDMLLHSKQDGKPLSFEDIREEVDTFMFEGHDTTAAATSWASHLIGANPHVQKKVHEELDSIFGKSDRDASMKDLKEMKYLECCIKEALRIFPSVPFFGRSVTEDVDIGGYTLPKGTTAVIVPVALHEDERYFPDPFKYDPDRFLPENCVGRHPYCYVPFSAGPRNCIGQKFALLEEKMLLSSIFRKYTVESMQTQEELSPVGELILRPQNGILVKLKTR